MDEGEEDTEEHRGRRKKQGVKGKLVKGKCAWWDKKGSGCGK